MKIVVLDGYTLNPGDLSWDWLKELGEIEVYDRTPADLTVNRLAGADIALTNKTPLGENEFTLLPVLKYVGVLATGFNVVDIESAGKRGIIVTNVPAYGTDSVAQMVFALLLDMCVHAREHSNAVMSGEWSASMDFCFWKHPLIELSGKTIGIVGMGRIGRKIAEIAKSFGMNILGHDINRFDSGIKEGFRWAELDELFRESDVVSLNCPLLPQTRNLVDAARLRMMKRSAFLINTSRGPLIVDNDLAWALNNGIIAGAGLDVLSQEPPSVDNPLLSARNCIITPHIAWATKGARQNLMNTVMSNLRSFMAGHSENVVNSTYLKV